MSRFNEIWNESCQNNHHHTQKVCIVGSMLVQRWQNSQSSKYNLLALPTLKDELIFTDKNYADFADLMEEMKWKKWRNLP